jgi:hypothetical protein
MSGGGGGGASGGGGMPGGMAGGGEGGGGEGGGGGIRGLGGQMPGTGGPGGAGEGGADCGAGLPGGVGGMEGTGECAGGVGEIPGETEAERKARLEGELDKSVGGFDEVLAEEQREISTVGRDTEGFGGGGGAGGGGGVGLGKQASGGIEGTGEEVARSGAAGSGSTPSIDSMSEEEIAKRTPPDIPDLVSEDIVAKQLKEAALAEDDPVLRERLWEEYRNYNNL